MKPSKNRKFYFTFLLFTYIFFLSYSHLFSEIRALWVPSWELTTPEKIDQLVEDAINNKINQILPEVRYRGDALYIPNREDSTFKNPEKRSYILTDSTNFDPLDYLLEKTKDTKIEIHAWLTIFVVTPYDLDKLSPEHVYFTHPEWITSNFQKKKMKPDSYEGAYLDPGIPEVHNYLLNIILDIIKNYDIAGVHFDYIRYPDTNFGYNEIAVTNYKLDTVYEDIENWQKWREDQVTCFLKKAYISIKNVSPETTVSAAVFPNLENACFKYSQNWLKWLQQGYLDKVYLMAYSTSNDDFENVLNTISDFKMNKEIVVGIRAWSKDNTYPVDKINDKIKFIKKKKFIGFSLFSYTGIIKNGYWGKLKFK
ncbi:MAG: family 10 glycosylhydrolase [Candidatus Cloacimonetes bacterium]|nr:family 10 glycosylhydrolase [Candidatus Cloacimonadota bacterium]